MGNQKTKKNTHTSRGKYQKRKTSRCHTTLAKENINVQCVTKPLEGNHIINWKQLASFVDDISAHTNSCKGKVSFIGETYHSGMASILSAKCSHCRLEIAFLTSNKSDGVAVGSVGSATLRLCGDRCVLVVATQAYRKQPPYWASSQ